MRQPANTSGPSPSVTFKILFSWACSRMPYTGGSDFSQNHFSVLTGTLQCSKVPTDYTRNDANPQQVCSPPAGQREEGYKIRFTWRSLQEYSLH